jgi:replicative DNA helicase
MIRRSDVRKKNESTEDRSSVVTPAPTATTENTLKIPHDPVNESVVIAAALVDPASRKWLSTRVPADAFFGKGHAAVWAMICEMERRGLQFDPMTVQQLTGGSVDSNYLTRLIDLRPVVPPNLKHHVESLEWDRVRVEAARGPVGALLEALRDQSSDPDKVRALSRQVTTSFNAGSMKYLRDGAELVREMVADIERRRTGVACYPYGIEGLDRYEANHPKSPGKPRLTPGAAPGQITVVTGLSGGGKTTFTSHIAIAQANMKRRVLYGAWEQGSRMTLELMAVQSLGFSRTAFVVGEITSTELSLVRDEALRLSEYVRFFELPFGRERGKRTMNDDHLDLIHAYISETGADVFIADLWRRAVRQFNPDDEEAALYRQQSIAVETKCHCILLHKDVEQREDKQPTREGLKGTGAWVEVPDTILGIHRDALWKDVPDTTLSAFVLKQRHGTWPLAVEFDWSPEHGSIKNGRSVEYKQPGQGGDVDNFLGEMKPKKRGFRGKNS